MRQPLLLVVPLLLTACPAAPQGEGEGEEGEEGEGDVGEGEGDVGEGEGDGGEGEGEGDVGEGEGEGEGDAACGEVVVDGATIDITEGLVVGRDGSVYYSQPGGVGRRSANGVVDDDWLALPGADTVWGVMLSPDNARLYAGSPSTSLFYVVDVASAAVEFSLDDFDGPNGFTVDGDGNVFVSDFFGDGVFKVIVGADDATVSLVTDGVGTPNGVLVDGDDLLILGYNDGQLYRAAGGRLGLATSTAPIVNGLGNPDGIVRAADGSFFVTDNGGGRLLHVDPAAAVDVVELRDGILAAANLEFGVAPLRCDRLLVTSARELVVVDVGQGGAPVPWR